MVAGIWYMHCHFEFHLSMGMVALFIVEDGSTVDTSLPAPPADFPTCGHDHKERAVSGVPHCSPTCEGMQEGCALATAAGDHSGHDCTKRNRHTIINTRHQGFFFSDRSAAIADLWWR
jgi:hypothetical protein